MQQRYNVIQGDVLDTIKNLPADYFDACLSDPPYGISFMGKEWDKGVPSSEVYAELLRVLKPGAMGLHFGGTRMWHRLACNLEEAGFELRDTVMWLYGSGFPKSHNISKAVDKQDAADLRRERQLRFTAWVRGTALTRPKAEQVLRDAGLISINGTMAGHFFAATEAGQPAIATRAIFEALRPHFGCEVPAWVEQLVDERTVESENFKKREVVGHQDGTLLAVAPGQDNDRAQTTLAITAPATAAAKQWDGWGTALKPAWEPALLVQKPLAGTFANNALTHGCGGLNIDGCRVGDREKQQFTGKRRVSSFGGEAQDYKNDRFFEASNEPLPSGRFPANLILDEEAGKALGDAQRFFYTAKVSTKERNAGLADFADKDWAADGACVPERENRPFNPSKNNHPTLKPIALTEYLARLLLVPARKDGAPRRLLVPFSGAGSEMIGALKAGWDEVWGIELDGDFVRIACARIEHHTGAVQLEAACEEVAA